MEYKFFRKEKKKNQFSGVYHLQLTAESIAKMKCHFSLKRKRWIRKENTNPQSLSSMLSFVSTDLMPLLKQTEKDPYFKLRNV